MKEEIDPRTLGRQLMKPEGDLGPRVGEIMNNTNTGLYDLAFSVLQVQPASSVLEIGFGNGAFFPRYFDLAPGVRVAGSDFSEAMCREAARRNAALVEQGRLVLRCEDALHLGFPTSSFDWAVGLNTIYFWQDPPAQLAEIKRVLQPGGRLLLGYRPKAAMEKLPFAQEFFRLFAPEELNALLAESGFSIETEEARDTQRVSADGAVIRSRDICVVAKTNA